MVVEDAARALAIWRDDIASVQILMKGPRACFCRSVFPLLRVTEKLPVVTVRPYTTY